MKNADVLIQYLASDPNKIHDISHRGSSSVCNIMYMYKSPSRSLILGNLGDNLHYSHSAISQLVSVWSQLVPVAPVK